MGQGNSPVEGAATTGAGVLQVSTLGDGVLSVSTRGAGVSAVSTLGAGLSAVPTIGDGVSDGTAITSDSVESPSSSALRQHALDLGLLVLGILAFALVCCFIGIVTSAGSVVAEMERVDELAAIS